MPLLLPTRRKASFSNSGYSGGGGNYPLGASHADVYRKSRPPTDRELLSQLVGIAYACINLNAHGVAKQQLRLYVVTKKGQKSTRWATQKVATKRLRAISEGKASGAIVRGEDRVEEVTDHPILSLLDIGQTAPVPNDSDELDDIRPELPGYTLIFMLQVYLELLGRAYLLVERDGLGVPQKVWLLRSHLVREVPDFTGKRAIAYYEYGGANGIRYTTDQVIRFHNPDPNNPYVGGYSPTMASIEEIRVGRKQNAHINAILDNAARPDAIWSPKGDTEGSSIGPVEAQRVRSAFRQAFAQAGQGGLLISEVPGSFQTLGWRPQDVVELDRAKAIKTNVCNAYGVPDAKLERNAANLASSKTADAAHAADAILPRCTLLASAFRPLLAMFDPSGRMFFAFDNPLPDDNAFALEQTRTGIDSGFLMVNEARAAIDEPPLEGGDIRYVSSDLVAINPDNTLAPANMQPGSIKPAPGAQEPPQGAGEISSDASKSLSDVTGALLRVTKLFEGLLSHAKGTAAGQDDSVGAGAEGVNGNGRHMLAYAKAQAEATTAEGEVKSSVDEPFRTVKYSPDEPRNAHGEWTDGGGEGEADRSASEAITAKPSKSSEFDGDPAREEMRKFAAKVNNGFDKVEAEAGETRKRVIADINSEYAKLQDSHSRTELGQAAEDVVIRAQDALSDNEELTYQDAIVQEVKNSPEGIRAQLRDIQGELGDAFEVVTENNPKATVADIVKSAMEGPDAESAVKTVIDKLPETMQQSINDDVLIDSLRSYGPLGQSDLDKEVFDDWAESEKEGIVEKAKNDVPNHYQEYLDRHSGRIGDAIESGGKINADKVFAKDDDDLVAVPKAAAEKFVTSVNATYAESIKRYGDVVRQVESRAAEILRGSSSVADDADKAVAAAYKELPPSDAKLIKDHADLIADKLVGTEYGDDFYQPDEEVIDEIAKGAIKSSLKDAPKLVRLRARQDEDNILDQLVNWGDLDHDFFDPATKEDGAKSLKRYDSVSPTVRGRMKAAGYSDDEIISRIVVGEGHSHAVMGLAPGDDVGWKKTDLSGGH